MPNTKHPYCPNCSIGLQIERDDGDVVWWGCPKCGHIEARDPLPPPPDRPDPRTT
ncbi:MAG: hypothetical protein IPH13_04135 [Planctomycetes bacterium]|nr:hypothetical protein [Planctomycetota bacterium]MCC7168937.1 hypothetical protein [Planctomycetota bacterium]